MPDNNPNNVEEYIRTNHMVGDEGEKDVIEKIKCPNCGRKETRNISSNYEG